MTKIDHFFATAEWVELFLRIDIQALASMGSDHCPILLQGDTFFDFYQGFRFKAYWTNMPGFLNTVKGAWEQPVNTQNAYSGSQDACQTHAHGKSIEDLEIYVQQF